MGLEEDFCKVIEEAKADKKRLADEEASFSNDWATQRAEIKEVFMAAGKASGGQPNFNHGGIIYLRVSPSAELRFTPNLNKKVVSVQISGLGASEARELTLADLRENTVSIVKDFLYKIFAA